MYNNILVDRNIIIMKNDDITRRQARDNGNTKNCIIRSYVQYVGTHNVRIITFVRTYTYLFSRLTYQQIVEPYEDGKQVVCIYALLLLYPYSRVAVGVYNLFGIYCYYYY